MFRAAFVVALAAVAAVAIAAPTPSSNGAWISMGPNRKPKTAHKDDPSDVKSSSRQVEDLSTIEKQSSCTDANQCSFVDRFKWLNGKRWIFAHDYANGAPFDTWWSKDKVSFNKKHKKVKITIGQEARHGKPYVSGHMQSTKWHGYGCYEVKMKPANQEGLITTFFSYTGKYDASPGAPKAHNEVDIEFVYKKKYGRVMMQANYFTNGRGGHEHIIPLKFGPVKKMHTYAFKWTSKSIEWYADGKKVYTAYKNLPKISQGPHKIMMNLWPVSSSASGWGGNFNWDGAKAANYAAIRFTRGEDCKIKNRL